MASNVKSLLKQSGPCLTSELARRMVELGASEAAARQRITRAQSEYTRLAGVRFAKNARFIYLEDQYGSTEFWRGLENAFKTSGTAYWHTIVGLTARGGGCPRSLFPRVCGAPIARKRQLSPDRILERLIAIQLLEVDDQDPENEVVRFHPLHYPRAPEAELQATMLAEHIALQAIGDWLKKLGFGSYGKFKVRESDELPIVSGIAWDLSAPSYLRPLAQKSGESIRPGFVVCDINLRGAISEGEVSQFVRKHTFASAPMNVAPIMPFLIGDVFTQDAFNLARQSGVVSATIADLFGTMTAKALRDLISLLSNSGATAAMNPQHLLDVLNSLTRIEGAANNLRGAVFELVAGSLAKDIEGGYLLTGLKRYEPYSGRRAEIDAILDRPNDAPVLILECKSKIPGAQVSLSEVQHWLDDRVPLILAILSNDQRYAERRFHFEFWSNGPFHPDAGAWLDTQTKAREGYSVDWKDGELLRTYSRNAKSNSIRDILKDHYFLHPLAKLAKKAI
ncbi:hypothetical protein [Ponticaulis profundi]|uniref:Uncharacterized protein n=1 Tax=Ponticaulis profundi TaxID=2665222 RepID=A0ABW1SD61_9PROT